MLSSTIIAHPVPGLLAQFVAYPESMAVSRTEHEALYYYQTTLSSIQTTKDPNWATSKVFLRLGSSRPLVMHLLLAASLESLIRNQATDDILDVLAIAAHHHQSGTKLLTRELSNTTKPDHVNVMTGFWFLYLYTSRQPNLELSEIKKLSQTVSDYVKKHQLDSLCIRRTPESASGTPASLSCRERSLLARLMIWIFYADISFGFRCRGGSLAKYLSENLERTERVYQTSRFVLELHWGSEYPEQQLRDDFENSVVLEMVYRSFTVYHAINELCDGQQTGRLAEESIERQLEDIEETYNSTLLLANSATRPRSRLLRNMDWGASLFYGIRIYYFRCTCPDGRSLRPPPVENALSSLLGIAYRTYTTGPSELYSCPQWPLLIAGAETSDPDHRDWILGNMAPTVYKTALEKIIQAQDEIGGRIEMSRLREMCDVGGFGVWG
jgi:hypothetical protein